MGLIIEVQWSYTVDDLKIVDEEALESSLNWRIPEEVRIALAGLPLRLEFASHLLIKSEMKPGPPLE